jgi:peptide/nickel transport system ATP-binding protein
MDSPLLELEDVSVVYRQRGGTGTGHTLALDNVSLTVTPGTSVGIVGESGSGKTTLLRVLAGLQRTQQGSVRFQGGPLELRQRAQAKRFRESVQLVFQDPTSSLDPRRRIWELVSEPAWALLGMSRSERRALTEGLLIRLGLPSDYADRRPHQLSGGERQRVALARALSTQPQAILLDEPVASLDASRRGQVINLINDVTRKRDIALVVVSHDLIPIALMTDFVIAMYHGRIVESGPTQEVIRRPSHPYTQLLVESVRDPLRGDGLDENIREEVTGSCPYAGRCPEYRKPACDTAPILKALPGGSHRVACHVREADVALKIAVGR